MRQIVPWLCIVFLLGCFDLELPGVDIGDYLKLDSGVPQPATGGSGTGGNGPHTGGNGFDTGGILHCFPADTPIDTPSGPRPIDQLRPGDAVWAYDHALDRPVVSVVTGLHRHDNRRLGVLETETGQTLHLTSDHPVFSEDQGRYVAAAGLAAGAQLLVAASLGSDRAERGLTGVQASMLSRGFVPTARVEPVFNLTVAGTHNYFAAGVLVHNKSPCSSTHCGWSGCPCANSGGYGGQGGYIDSCFGPGTPIDTPSGPRAIEALVAGDAVWAFDHSSGQRVVSRVTATHHHPPGVVGRLRIGAGAEVQVTGNHPIFDGVQQRYRPASEMAAGASVLVFEGGFMAGTSEGDGQQLAELRLSEATYLAGFERSELYNLTVAGQHNYFAGGVLVHNKSPPCSAGYWPPATCGPCPAWENGYNCDLQLTGPCVNLGLDCEHPVLGAAPVCAGSPPQPSPPSPPLLPVPAPLADAGLPADGALPDAALPSQKARQRAAYLDRLVGYFGLNGADRERLATAAERGSIPLAIAQVVASPRGTRGLGEIAARWLSIPSALSQTGAGSVGDALLGEFVLVTGRQLATPGSAGVGHLLTMDWQRALWHAQSSPPFAPNVDPPANGGEPPGQVGLLTSGAFLRAHPTPSDRGRAVAEALLCGEYAPHQPPAIAPAVTSTRYAAYSQLAVNPLCVHCHGVIDPLGLALESYDADGTFRTSENGVEITPTGQVQDTVVFGANGLAERLATVAGPHCVARSLLRSALGRPLAPQDACSIQWVEAGLGSEVDLRNGILSVATSEAFVGAEP